MLNFHMPARFFSGEGCVAENRALLRAFGASCVLVTGRSAARKSGALDDVEEALKKESISLTLYDRITENPSVASCREAGQLAADFGAEFVIGIGGGSALDAAKAVSVFAANPGLTEEEFYARRWEKAPLPIVLVGTTAGTGSEVTKVSVLTDSKGRKHSIHDDRLYAALAFGDPRYTMTLPSAVTLSTGIDVLAHCGESYFNRKADRLSRAFAVAGIRELLWPLREAAGGEPLTLPEREQLYEASILGGLAINTTGTCYPHNVGYYLTENYGIPHGFASAVFFPDLLARAELAFPEESERFFGEIHYGREALEELIASVLPPMNVRLRPEEVEEALPRWENNGSVMNTMFEVGREEIREMLLKLK